MSERSSLLILNHTPQDECSLEKYHHKLWNSVRRINTKLVVWHNLRDQIFHRNKMNARGSIRKAPNVITWAISLNKLSQAGDKDAGVIIKAWNLMASDQQKLKGGQCSGAQNCAGLYATRGLHQHSGSSGERDGLGEMPLER